ncbi:DDHD domain-containing protein [Microdochium trichocladiopsis]|uniref:DDHD domain-containing protein n=1 Tax=Microdochium trichocladiopsis TaxID=1682393 RepID=A0A9P9BK52_9PEZI|nr:DDHD domain-containing protein [Microdochium trichocladiopsis]KAH7026274.1 DDHD domain-containing protein [Microdochium trichocladiopsis]
MTPPQKPSPGANDASAQPAGTTDKKPEKSYFASAVESINPWGASRSSTPTPKDGTAPPPSKPAAGGTAPKKADDHSINSLYGRSFKSYPPDCPPLKVMWFHAIDIPKRKPQFLKSKKEAEEVKPNPAKKFLAFSNDDARSIEASYQRLLEEAEADRMASRSGHFRSRSQTQNSTTKSGGSDPTSGGGSRPNAKVPVNEDYLFEVDIDTRELAPVYWLGPIYEVRRGTWFYQEASTLRPCDENLAAQLEEGYLKVKPWAYAGRGRSNSGAPQDVTPKASVENLKSAAKAQSDAVPKNTTTTATAEQQQPQAHRLFGTYMNSVATYQDANTAWLSSEGVFSWVTSSVYQRFAGGGYMNGVKLVRGYTDPGKAKDEKKTTTPTTATFPEGAAKAEGDGTPKALKRRSAPASAQSEAGLVRVEDRPDQVKSTAGSQLKDKLSSVLDTSQSTATQDEEVRQLEEQEIRDDYTGQDGEKQGREIEHLVLVTHGIGQMLSMRMESVNFVHDVNLLRKTTKSVYTYSADLKALNGEPENGPGNCRVQVLPVCWRHMLDFPKRKEKKGEHDLTDAFADEDEYPSLEDITIEGLAFARSLISDLALDVLLYQSAYREQITEIVLKECNRIYHLFKQRNPGFKGKVHIAGHSLGSAIMFDILCRQKEKSQEQQVLRNPKRAAPSQSHSKELSFDFEVDDFYCLGSPVGLFQMLKGRTIAARKQPNAAPSESPLVPEDDDPFLLAEQRMERVSPITGLSFSVSSPKAAQLFNIFHPSDPIAYRLEPLISPAMSSLKPQILPYTKRGFLGAVAPQGLSGIGVKVGQSVSGLWSGITSGIASSLLTRGLGFTNEDVAAFNASGQAQQTQAATAAAAAAASSNSSPPLAAGTNIGDAAGVVSTEKAAMESASQKADMRKRALARHGSMSPSLSRRATGGGANQQSGAEEGTESNPILIDDELETLYARFQKKRVEEHKDSISRADEGQELGEAWAAEERKAQKLRREELKVRALNRNGRVDYAIQESALDFNPINTIASHMCYWQDEDVSHFMLSQMLSNRSMAKVTDEPLKFNFGQH